MCREYIGFGGRVHFLIRAVCKGDMVVRVRGLQKDNITLYVAFFVKVEHGTDSDGEPHLKLTDVVRLKPVLVCRASCPQGSPEASPKRQACPALQDEAEGWQGVLFNARQSE